MAFQTVSWGGKNQVPNDPYSAMAYQADAGLKGAQANAWGQQAAAANQAQGMIGSTLYAQPGEFAKALASTYGSYAPAMANAYGSYAGGLAGVANSMANERSAMYGANAMAEAARQGAVSNIGSAALGAYGGIGNSALSAWAQNQVAYKNAAAAEHQANQGAMSTYGASKNAALAGLGQPYADMTGRLAGASAISNLSGSFGGFGGGDSSGGFSATGAGGPIASGSYGGGGGGGSSGFSFSGGKSSGDTSGYASAGYGGLAGLANGIASPDIPNRLDARADAGMSQLDREHYSSRMMPSMMMDQALGGLLQLGGQAYGNASNGMEEFYKNQNRAGNQFMQSVNQSGSGILDRLTSGYGGTSGGLASGYNNANSQIRSLWDSSLGQLDAFKSPVQKAQDAEALRQYNRQIDQTKRNEQALNLGSRDSYIQNAMARLDADRRGMALSPFGSVKLSPEAQRMMDPNWVSQNAGLEYDRRKLAALAPPR